MLKSFLFAIGFCALGLCARSSAHAAETKTIRLPLDRPGIYQDHYLQDSQIPLGDLDSKLSAATGIVVTQKSGPAMSFKLRPGNMLYFLSPAEQHRDTESVLAISGSRGGEILNLRLKWYTLDFPALSRVDETAEEEDAASFVQEGLSIDGKIGRSAPASVTFRLKGAPALDPSSSQIQLWSKADQGRDIQDWFSLNAAGTLFKMKPEHLARLPSLVRASKTVALRFSLTTTDDSSTYTYSQELIYAGAALELWAVNPDGSSATEFAGKQYVVRRDNPGRAREFPVLATLGVDAKFRVHGLPAGDYVVREVLPESGIAFMGFCGHLDPDGTALLKIFAQPQPAPGGGFGSSQCLRSVERSR